MCQTVPISKVTSTIKTLVETKSLSKGQATQRYEAEFKLGLASMRKMTVIMSTMV